MNTRTRVREIPISASNDLAAPAGSIINLWDYTVPAREIMRFKKFGNELNVPGNWGLLRWDFLVNGAVLPGFANLRNQMGFGASPAPIEEREIPGGSYLEVRATQETGAACRVGIAFVFELEGQG